MPTDKLRSLILNTARDNQLPAKDLACELIDQGANTNECLLLAASYHRSEFIKWLIDHGKANVNFPGPYGRTPLLRATSEASFYKNDLDCIRTLLSHGANPNLYADYGKSPLLTTRHFIIFTPRLNPWDRSTIWNSTMIINYWRVMSLGNMLFTACQI